MDYYNPKFNQKKKLHELLFFYVNCYPFHAHWKLNGRIWKLPILVICSPRLHFHYLVAHIIHEVNSQFYTNIDEVQIILQLVMCN